MSSYLWLDAETTGLKSNVNDIIQFACIPIINDKEYEAFNEYCQPTNWNNIDQEALDVHGISIDQMKTFQTQEEMLTKLINYLEALNTQFTIAGFNVDFDKSFISETFKKHNKSLEYSKLFNLDVHDTFKRAKSIGKKILNLDSLKLSILANKFNIEIDAHNAISDIRATILVDKELSKLMGESQINYVPDLDVNLIDSNLMPEPVQLHIHSQYSMLTGVLSIEKWIDWCIENKSPGLSITDHGVGISLFRSVRLKEYLDKYNKKNNKNISTNDLTMIPGLGLNYIVQDGDEKYYTLNAWAISNEGYTNLVELSSIGFSNSIEENKENIPIVKLSDILRLKGGLLFGTACVNSYIGDAVEKGDIYLAESRFLELFNSFRESLLFEFSPTDITHKFYSGVGFKKVEQNSFVKDGNLQKAYNRCLALLSTKYSVKCVPTTAACFIDKQDKVIQDCMKKNGHKNGEYTHESYHQRSSTMMFKELKVHLGQWLTEDKYKEWINNTYQIANEAKNININFEYHLPKIEIPTEIQNSYTEYKDQIYHYTIKLIKEHGRWIDNPIYIERFNKEIDVIHNNQTMSFLPYFLMYEDLGRFARQAGFLQNIARGSAGGSLLSYYLKVIHVDPIKADLPFERFLSHARIRAGSWPDIDMDIAKTARPYIMKYLQDKYGYGFAQISTISTMKIKNAIKDAVNALYNKSRTDFEIDALCKTLDDSPQGVSEKDFIYGYTDQEGEYHEGELDRNEMLRNYFDQNPEVKSMVDRLIGTMRGWSRHASAFVISTLNLHQRLPMMKMFDKHINDYIYVTQYSAEMVEKVGLVKADILGLKTLSAVTDAVKLIQKNKDYLQEDENGLALLYRLPEDEKIYTDFYNKDTDSSFQFNTPVVKNLIQDFIPTRRSHNMALTALLRPGAMDAKMIGIEGCEHLSATQYYTDVRSGKRQVQYIHPDLENILKDSNGVYCFQEEIMRFLVEIVGYSLEESDSIRSAIAKKKHDVMMASFDRIRQATSLRGWNETQQEAMCQTIMAFSRYSFNKSHSYAYAELGYITMYLKHYHPLEWWTAILNNEDDEDKTRLYISLLGDKIKPPSMKKPMAEFFIEGNHIVSPISVCKSVGPKAVEELCLKGPFVDLSDFIKRVNHTKVNIGAIGQMIKARAADVFMQQGLQYSSSRLAFMKEYKEIRGKITTDFKEELYNTNPISIFLMEKETNKSFNKTILSDKDIVSLLVKSNNFIESHKNETPLFYRSLLVLRDSHVALNLVTQNYDKKIAMTLLYQSSEIKKGVTKKGKPYVITKIIFSDGINDIEAALWDNNKPLSFKKDSLIAVTGILSKGWKTDISITINEMNFLGGAND